ncbi:hypothetical protein [Nesterenkonia sandarakina]|uniref:hypothetical protein n=1 Tax=Nesterenkonia sandarakina TaxID=272918 RepID=UPI00215905D0|nr:hypothetical protein [Nesterenkonia sandarakina]
MPQTPTGDPSMSIDRRALVARHAIRRSAIEPGSPIQLGNGELGLSVDGTGLQTFPELHPHPGRDPEHPGSLLGTQTQWGWHTTPLDPRPSIGSATRRFATARGSVPYVDLSTETFGEGPESGTEAELWLRENPHRLMLGWIGLAPSSVGGSELSADDLQPISQELDLWTGIAESRFTLLGFAFTVRTAVHPARDVLGISIATDSPHAPALRLRFPYGSGAWGNAASWQDERHSTTVHDREGSVVISRSLDESDYSVSLGSDQPLRAEQQTVHDVVISTQPLPGGQPWEISVSFRPGPASRSDAGPAVTPDQVFEASARWWEQHWTGGGVVDLSGSTDLRAPELERRIVLSQYLTAINCSGSTPPQETGLMINSWRGKFHLEMHWWHAAHFPVWGRPALLQRSPDWYHQVLPEAQPRLVSPGAAGGAAHGRGPGRHRGPLAQTGGTGGGGDAQRHRSVPALAAAPPDLLRGAAAAQRRDGTGGTVRRARLRDGRVHGDAPERRRRRGQPRRPAPAGPGMLRRCEGRAERSDLRTGLLALGSGHRDPLA